MRATFEKKRGKLLSKRQDIISSDLSQSKSSIREPEIALRLTSKDTSIRRALEQAQSMLQEERETREDLQRKVARLQMRGIDRQKEFRRIIQEAIPFCLKDRSAAVLNADLRTVQSKLLDFFEVTQTEVERNLQEERHALEQQMQRRIQAVTNHAQQQIHQQKRLQTLNYETIHRQITTALSNCTTILTENEDMKRQIKELSFNNAILKEERSMLIEEVLEKKNLILKMYAQLKEKYSRDDEIDKEIALMRQDRQRVEKQYAKYEENERKEIEGCFRTIESIRPKAVHLFTTDPANPPQKIPSHSHSKEKPSPVRFSSTVDVKSRSAAKTSLHRTIATCSSEKDEGVTVIQLRESLRRERRKTLLQAQKIDYLVGYKRDIDLFVRECYRRGDLEGLDTEKVQRILDGLKRVVQKETIEQERPNATTKSSKEYELLLEDY